MSSGNIKEYLEIIVVAPANALVTVRHQDIAILIAILLRNLRQVCNTFDIRGMNEPKTAP